MLAMLSNNHHVNDDLMDQIIYRGEGNSSIVVALKSSAKVIRLLKKDGKLMKSCQDHHASQHPMRNIRFMHLIMKPLTAPFLSDTTELVHLKSGFINVLSEKVEIERPVHRLDKTLHLDDQYALVMDDLCALPMRVTRYLSDSDFEGPTISVEIKPKQGFVPPAYHLDSDSRSSYRELSISTCLYSMTQYLKQLRGRITDASNYCPINLFSGCPVKMRSALSELIRHPQNNFRIFKDLVLVYDEKNHFKEASKVFKDLFHHKRVHSTSCSTNERLVETNKEHLINLLIQCLLNEPKVAPSAIPRSSVLIDLSNAKDHESTSSNYQYNNICAQHMLDSKCRRCDTYTPSMKKYKYDSNMTSKMHSLPQSCVLASVLRAQKLDTIGAYKARHMLEWLIDDAKGNEIDVLEELSKPNMPSGFGSECQLYFESTRDYYFRKVWEFLVSLTAKDCSIIITMRRISPSKQEALLVRHRDIEPYLLKDKDTDDYYIFSVGIADLDQKMPLKIMRICENLNQIMIHARSQDDHRCDLLGAMKGTQKVAAG